MRTILSIFDHSGNWPAYYPDLGYDVIHLDLQNDLLPFDILEVDSAETALDLFEDVDGIMAAVPCTDFTSACAWCWPAKDADGRTAKSIKLVYQVLCLVDLFMPDWWCIENPVGRMRSLVPGVGQPIYIDPYEYAGWLDPTPDEINELDRIRSKGGVGVTRQEWQLVWDLNAYTKKTGLYGNFTIPTKRPIASVKTCSQGSVTQRLGGKSERTKRLRSETPLGFSKAFAAANP